jgi:hypothetical protein
MNSLCLKRTELYATLRGQKQRQKQAGFCGLPHLRIEMWETTIFNYSRMCHPPSCANVSESLSQNADGLMRARRFRVGSSRLIRPSLAYRLQKALKRHAWLILGLLLAVLSASLLQGFLMVHGGPPDAASELHISANTAYNTNGRVDVFFGRHEDKLEISFAIPSDGAEFVRLSVTNPVDASVPCQTRPGGQATHGTSANGINWAEYTFEGQPIAGRIAVSCSVKIVPASETFAERKVFFQNVDDARPTFSGAFTPTDLALHTENFNLQDDSTDVRFEGGIAEVEGGDIPIRLLKWGNGNRIVAEWTDLRRAQERDGGLVIIGAVVALAATCLMEWIRPWMSPNKDS